MAKSEASSAVPILSLQPHCSAAGPRTCLLLLLTFQNCFLKAHLHPLREALRGTLREALRASLRRKWSGSSMSQAGFLALCTPWARPSPRQDYPWGLSPAPRSMRPAQCVAGPHKDEWRRDTENRMNIKLRRCLLSQSGGHAWWRRGLGSRPGGLHWGRQGSPGQRSHQCWPGNFRWAL